MPQIVTEMNGVDHVFRRTWECSPEKERRQQSEIHNSKAFVVACPEETRHDALKKINESGLPILSVVFLESPRQVVGVISKHDIFQAYELDAETLSSL